MPKTVLVFIDWYLPGFKAGGPVTSCANMIDALRDKIRFRVVTRNTDYCESSTYEDIESNQWVSRGINEEVMYLSNDQLNYRTIQRIIHETEFDVIYINGLYSRFFSIYPLLALRGWDIENKRNIVAVRGMLARSAIGIKHTKKTFFLRIARWLGLYRNVIFHVTNPDEEQDVKREINHKAKTMVAANISKMNSRGGKAITKEKNTLKILSIARIAPEKNLLFLLELLAEVPEINIGLTIYGPVYSDKYWEECQQAIKKLPHYIRVEYKGEAQPIDIPEIIQNHHALVMPSRGENFGHVIAESFLHGRPVVISDQTPWRNLQANYAGFDLSLNQPAAFRNALVKLAESTQQEYDQWVLGATRAGDEIASNSNPVQQHIKLFTSEGP